MSATFALSAAAPVGRAAAASTSLRQRLLKSSPRQPGGARRTTRGGTVYARVSGTERTSTTSQISSQIKDIRSQMEEDEDLNTLMAGLRGTNIDDSDFAADGVKMRVVDLDKIKAEGGDDDRLPLYYDPELIAQYWRRRPGAVAQRILQLSKDKRALQRLLLKGEGAPDDSSPEGREFMVATGKKFCFDRMQEERAAEEKKKDAR